MFARKFNIIGRKKNERKRKEIARFFPRLFIIDGGKKIVGGKKSRICHECKEARYVVGRSTEIGLEDKARGLI